MEAFKRLENEDENKKDEDCKKEGQLCGGIKYCYTDIVYINPEQEN